MAAKQNAASNVTELRARQSAEPIASFLKTSLLELSPGYARVSMKLRLEYRNFIGSISGGIIMAIADQSFAYASNSLSLPSAASQFNIYFLAVPKLTDELIAECRVLKSGRRTAVSEMTVTDQDGKLIARAAGTTIPLGTR